MSNGKRRANWEKVLEERMAEQQQLISSLNIDRLNQITDLQNEVYVMKKTVAKQRYFLIATAYFFAFTAIMAVLK